VNVLRLVKLGSPSQCLKIALLDCQQARVALCLRAFFPWLANTLRIKAEDVSWAKDLRVTFILAWLLFAQLHDPFADYVNRIREVDTLLVDNLADLKLNGLHQPSSRPLLCRLHFFEETYLCPQESQDWLIDRLLLCVCVPTEPHRTAVRALAW
jgi:hypothetical protein